LIGKLKNTYLYNNANYISDSLYGKTAHGKPQICV